VHEFVQDLFATSVQSSLAMLYGMYSEDEDYPLLVNAPIREFCDEKGRVVDREAMLSWIPQGLVVGQYAALSEEYRKADEAARISYKAKMKLFNGDEDALAAAVEADPAKYKGFLDKQERALQLQVQLALVTARLRVAYVDEGQPAWLTEVLRKNGFHFVQPLYGPAAAAFYAEVAFYGETDTLKWVDDARYIERLRALLVDYDTAEQAMQTDLAELPAGADLSDPTTIPAGMALKLSVDALILQGQQLNVLMELERFERLPERHNITVHPGGVNYDDFEPEGPDD
jgi:hypothetical protein